MVLERQRCDVSIQDRVLRQLREISSAGCIKVTKELVQLLVRLPHVGMQVLGRLDRTQPFRRTCSSIAARLADRRFAVRPCSAPVVTIASLPSRLPVSYLLTVVTTQTLSQAGVTGSNPVRPPGVFPLPHAGARQSAWVPQPCGS